MSMRGWSKGGRTLLMGDDIGSFFVVQGRVWNWLYRPALLSRRADKPCLLGIDITRHLDGADHHVNMKDRICTCFIDFLELHICDPETWERYLQALRSVLEQ